MDFPRRISQFASWFKPGKPSFRKSNPIQEAATAGGKNREAGIASCRPQTDYFDSGWLDRGLPDDRYRSEALVIDTAGEKRARLKKPQGATDRDL
jgi:hypothetical protein